MKVLNIGLDKTLVGLKGPGDAVQRHREYGQHLKSLDIIVYTKRKENLRVFEIASNVTGYPTNSRNKFFFLWDAYRIARRIYRHHQFDIVVAQDPFGAGVVGWLLKRKLKIKLQINFHGDFWRNRHFLKERWYHFIYLLISKLTVPQADAIRVMSQGQREKLLQAGVIPQLIRVISTPVDIERFAAFESIASPSRMQLLNDLRAQTSTQGRKTILAVGRVDKAKDDSTLFKAVRYVKARKGRDNVCFWLVGFGLSKNIPGDLLDMVTGQGGVDSDDTPAYYYASDVIVSSSSSESFGKVLVEANACGKPVVATATLGAQEIIKDGYNGYLVPIGDSVKLAEKLIYLLENPAIAKQMGENGRILVREKFSHNTKKIIRFWEDMLAGNL